MPGKTPTSGAGSCPRLTPLLAIGLLLLLLLPVAGRTQSTAPAAGDTQTPDKPDSSGRHHTYFALLLATGVGLQVSGHHSAPMGLSLPYSATDAFGNTTTSVYTSPLKTTYLPVRFFVLPIGFEVGTLRHTFSISAYASVVQGSITGGYPITAGYGFNWQLNAPGEHERDPAKKALVLKAVLNLFYSWERGGNGSALIGRIDNTGKVLRVLGYTADSVWTENPSRYSDGGTYKAKNLDLAYGERELALLPKIVLATNPYRYTASFQLEIGYMIPLTTGGSIYIWQDDGSYSGAGHQNFIGGPLRLDHPGLKATYNGAVVRSAPYRLNGFYVELSVWSVGRKDRRRKNAHVAHPVF
jgi:hypothetical protein